MKIVTDPRNTLIALGVATLSLGALAQSADEHKDHHPANAQPAATDRGAAQKLGQMDAQMKTMKEMHQKFMAAKTPDERMALMPENMKSLQEAMAMMDDMRANPGEKGGMGMMGKIPMEMMTKHQMMERRLDMMQSMMQMMMDQMLTPATK